jgi:hypothetical protein
LSTFLLERKDLASKLYSCQEKAKEVQKNNLKVLKYGLESELENREESILNLNP